MKGDRISFYDPAAVQKAIRRASKKSQRRPDYGDKRPYDVVDIQKKIFGARLGGKE